MRVGDRVVTLPDGELGIVVDVDDVDVCTVALVGVDGLHRYSARNLIRVRGRYWRERCAMLAD